MNILTTERLVLSQIEVGDAAFILRLLTNDNFIRNIGDKGVKTLEEAKKHIQEKLILSYQTHGFGLYLVRLKNSKTPIGTCGLVKRDSLESPDIGYAFLPEFCGQGYAIESARAVMAYATSVLGIKRVVGITSVENQASIKVLKKLQLDFEKMVPYEGGGESMLFVPR